VLGGFIGDELLRIPEIVRGCMHLGRYKEVPKSRMRGVQRKSRPNTCSHVVPLCCFTFMVMSRGTCNLAQ
jgi:hypothetical protein